MVQLFFAYRVQVLTRNWWLLSFIIVTALGSLFGGIGTAIAVSYVPSFTKFREFSVIVIIWLFSASLCDITLTITLTYQLKKFRRGFNPSTDDVLNKIVRLTVQNGFITTIWATTDLILFLVSPTGLHLAFNYPLAKLYSNSALSTLNARSITRDDSTNTCSHGTLNHRESRRPGHNADICTPGSVRTQVFVDIETHEMVDDVDPIKHARTRSG